MPTLENLPKGACGIISSVSAFEDDDLIATRLEELGFVPGAAVKVVAKGLFKRDPIAVCVGSSCVALRRNEASRISLCHDD